MRRARELPLGEFIAHSEGLENPYHLAPFLSLFDRAERGEEIRALISVPPQHGKSLAALHGLIRHLLRNPRKRTLTSLMLSRSLIIRVVSLNVTPHLTTSTLFEQQSVPG